jgi:hypothetical protein
MLTPESVLALAPDDSSAKAARGLTSAEKWPTLGADDAAVWGECQGSGSKPYQTQVDLAGPSFRCSCPSRKFPCKHGLALLLLRAQDASRFASPRPPWVDEWLASREQKEKKKEERDAQKAAAPPPDPAAVAKREAQRWGRIEGAAQDLERWLADQLARGLGALDDKALEAWRTMAARMVDAQAPGLGQRLLDAAAVVREGEHWPEHCLHRLGLLQLACDALQRRAALPESLQDELRVVAGWPIDKDDVLARGEAVQDRWAVIGVVTDERDTKLVERRVWLHGTKTAHRALVLDHAFAGGSAGPRTGQGFEQMWVAGRSVDATLRFFPGAARLRALVADAVRPAGEHAWPAVAPLVQEWDHITQRAAASPWVRLHPLMIDRGVPVRAGDAWFVATEGQRLPLEIDDASAWMLLAASGGHPLTCAGEWDGETFAPLLAWHGAQRRAVWRCRSGA